MAAESSLRWRCQPWPMRLALSVLILVLLGGLGASGRYMAEHYENRDGVPGLSLDDVRGHYHGVHRPAALAAILEQGHRDPDANTVLSAGDRAILLDWLAGDRISEDYDNLDLGDAAPAEIIALNCLDCHSRQADHASGIGAEIPLETWRDVKQFAFEQQIEPTAPAIVLASLHTHSLGMALIGLAAVILLIGTRWPRWLVGLLAVILSLGLAADVASWLPARTNVTFVLVIVGGGFAFAAGTTISLLAVLVDLWRPAPKTGPTH